MGSIASKTTDSNMGNCISDPSKNVAEMKVGGFEANRPKSTAGKAAVSLNSHRDIVAVSVDHNDIRVRAGSEQSVSSSGNSFSVKSGTNVNCVKNGQVVSVVLLPHQHSLFCERKQRVCTAAGKVQEMEVLRVMGLDLPLTNSVWIRTANGAAPTSAYSAIPGSENKTDYMLGREDVGCYVSFRHAWVDPPESSLASPSNSVDSQQDGAAAAAVGAGAGVARVIQAENAIGPVAAGPARLLDLRVVGTGAVLVSNSVSGTASTQRGVAGAADDAITVGELHVNQFAMAHANYIGGEQGCSEFWWLKTNPDGSRKELSQRAPIAEGAADVSYLLGRDAARDPTVLDDPNAKDPRLYLITREDIGCTLKVKCCPKRSDGYSGEVCTSKPSVKISAAPDVAEKADGEDKEATESVTVVGGAAQLQTEA